MLTFYKSIHIKSTGEKNRDKPTMLGRKIRQKYCYVRFKVTTHTYAIILECFKYYIHI